MTKVPFPSLLNEFIS